MLRTNDPLHDYMMQCEEDEEWLEKRPKCSNCGEHIQDEFCTVIDGNTYCDDCIRLLRRSTEDLMEV